MMLSILIRSIESRGAQLDLLMNHLYKQCQGRDEVEVLVLVDNKEISSGAKANQLLSMAKGKYIVFIDDDDWVADYYVDEMLKGCASDCDCMAINGTITTDGANEMRWKLSRKNPNVTIREGKELVYLRTTNHITAVKRELALKAGFPNKSNAEDKAYSDALQKYLKTEFTIHPPMYFYRYLSYGKEY